MTIVEIRRAFIRFFISLRVTIVLLALSIVLVFWGTLAQVHLGIWGVQDKFFRSLIVLGTIPKTDIPVPLFPGGYFLGGLLLINLVVSHVYRFRFTWDKAGIQLTHFGLILLLVGELVTSLFQEEYQLRLDENQSRNYAESFRANELVVIDTTDPDWDDVVAIPEPILARGRDVQHPALPFRVVTRRYLPNANLGLQDPAAPRDFGVPNLATRGLGAQVAVTPLRLTHKENERNLPAAYVELHAPEGPIGTWLVSPMLVQPQTFEYRGRSYRLALRFSREYKPFSLTLHELRHDSYPGSNIPKNFSSLVRLESADGRDDFEALIYMNNPLRHRGLTYYQYQMDSASGFSVLQVVRNPGWTIPYIACVLMSLGLTLQFGRHLLGFIARRRAAV